MQQVIILNGPAGVGKTSVGKLLAQKSENSVCISGDALKDFIVRKTDTVKGRLGYKNGASLIYNFLNAGYELVIFEYVFPSKKQIEYFLEELKVDVPVFLYTLWAPLEVVKEREARRIERASLGEQVIKCHEELASNLNGLGQIIHTDQLAIEDVVENILKLSKKERTAHNNE